MKRRFMSSFAMILILSIITAMMFQTAVSASEDYDVDASPWDGTTVAAGYAAGDGSDESPFVIASAAQFAYFRDQVNASAYTLGQYYILACDIDLGGNEWAPIGPNNSITFQGIFDGRGHTISNFKITKVTGDEKANLGLFGHTYSAFVTIQNFNIANAELVSEISTYIGAVVGYLQQGSRVTGVTVAEDVVLRGAGGSLGGIVGRAVTGATVEFCVNRATLTSEGVPSFVGGIAGVVGNTGTVSYCANYGSISSIRTDGTDSAFYAGGLIGCIGSSSVGGSVRDSYNAGSVSSSVMAGGIVAFVNTSGCAVENSYNLSAEIEGDVPNTGSVIGCIKFPVNVTGCLAKAAAGYGLWGSNVTETQTDFSGMSESSDSAMRVKTDAIDENIANEISRLAAIEYGGSPSDTSDDTTADNTTPADTTPDATTPDDTTPDDTTPDATTPDATTPGKTDDKKGCGSSAAFALAPVLLCCAALIGRRKND